MQHRFTISATLFVILLAVMTLFPQHNVAQQMPLLSPNQLVLPATGTVQFEWYGDSVNSNWEPHAGLLLPVKLPNCTKQFYMQFDLGSPSSLFYAGKIKAIQSQYPNTIPVNDSAMKLKNVHFTIGKMQVVATEISLRQNGSATINWTDKNSITIIGTIGSDFIDNKVAVIDYPQKKLTLDTVVPSNLNAVIRLSDFYFTGRSVLLPATINGKKSLLYFDTGSSAYELLTDQKTCRSLSLSDTVPVQYRVKAYYGVYTANTYSVKDSIEMAFHKLPIRLATYMEGVGAAQVEQMLKMGISGMTGNKLFLDDVVVLDTKNKKFGIIRSRKSFH